MTIDRFWQAAARILEKQAGVREMSLEEMEAGLKRIASTLYQISAAAPQDLSSLVNEEVRTHYSLPTPPQTNKFITASEAIQDDYILCLECGDKPKELGKKHLQHHGLTAAEYRQKHGYSPNQALMCHNLSRSRSEAMKKHQIWAKKSGVPSHGPDIDARDAIQDDYIICMECGKKLQVISVAHLRKHGLSKDDYCDKWGYPRGTRLVSNKQREQAKANSAKRMAKEELARLKTDEPSEPGGIEDAQGQDNAEAGES